MRYVESLLPEGRRIRIEVPDDVGGFADIGSKSVIDRADSLFREGLEMVESIAAAVYAKLVDVGRSVDPSEMSLEFGIKLAGQAGVVLAKISSEACLQVKLTWDRRGVDPSAPDPST